MSDVTNLQQRLDAELGGATSRARQSREGVAQADQERQARLKQFEALLERLRPVWAPRLELLRERFAKLVKAEPDVKPYSRGVTFAFTSHDYRVDLKMSVSPDQDVRHLVLDYDLLIIPMTMKYDRHARLEVLLDRVDEAAVARWLDDQLVTFVKTYVALQGDSFFLENLPAE